MSLPVLIRRVRYKVAGSYAFKGSLILAEEVIYFIPLKHLRKTKPPDFDGAAFAGIVGQVGIAGLAIGAAGTLPDDSIRLFNRPGFDSEGIWRDKPSNDELKRKLDAHIAELKKYPSYSSDDLPAPCRYSKTMVRNLALSSMGKLSFETEFENHIFKIGILGKNELRRALTEGGFMS